MRIGIGNKRFDQFSFLLSGVILIALLVWTFKNINALAFFIIFFVVTLIQFVRKMSFSYISFERGDFVIENLVNKKKILRSDLFDRVSRSNLGSPFMNVLRVHFKNGESYKIMGGLNRWDEIETQIEGLVKKERKL